MMALKMIKSIALKKKAAASKEQLVIMDDPNLKTNPFLEISESDVEEANDPCLLLHSDSDYSDVDILLKINKLLNYKK